MRACRRPRWTDTDYVAAGEAFTLTLGVADGIKLSRTLDRRRSSLTRGQRTRLQVAFDLRVENLGTTAQPVRLIDRVPVSEEKDIRVYGIDIRPDGKPDSKGLVQWDFMLAAGETRDIRIKFAVEYPAELLLRTPESGAPAADAEVSGQLRQIEALF